MVPTQHKDFLTEPCLRDRCQAGTKEIDALDGVAEALGNIGQELPRSYHQSEERRLVTDDVGEPRPFAKMRPEQVLLVFAKLGHVAVEAEQHGLQAGCAGVVQDHKPWVVDQRQHQEQPLALATAQGRKGGSAPVCQPETLDQVPGVPPSKQAYSFANPESIGQGRALELAADFGSEEVGLGNGVEAEDAQRPRVGPA